MRAGVYGTTIASKLQSCLAGFQMKSIQNVMVHFDAQL